MLSIFICPFVEFLFFFLHLLLALLFTCAMFECVGSFFLAFDVSCDLTVVVEHLLIMNECNEWKDTSYRHNNLMIVNSNNNVKNTSLACIVLVSKMSMMYAFGIF